MNINLTELFGAISLYFWLSGILLGTVVVNMLARQKVKHVIRSTIIGFLLSFIMPLVFIQLILLLKKNNIEEKCLPSNEVWG